MMLRNMQPPDIPACARLMAESPLWQRYQVTERSATRRFEQGLARQATIIVAELDGQIAGFIWYITTGAFGRSGYIALIGVQAGQRSQGIGRNLMEAAEERMFSTVSDVFVLTSDFNEPAQRFYERQGYQRVGSIPDYIITGVAELIYHKCKPDVPD
jgi:ribosomal protein S18 acetylase RimI-like enzyme